MKFRKKPVVIEAVRWDPSGKPTDLPEWLWNVLMLQPEMFRQETGTLTIRTLEGDMRAEPGDWIIKGVKGELYPCKPDIFEATYEPVERGTPAFLSQALNEGDGTYKP